MKTLDIVLFSITTDWISAIGTLVGIPVAAWGIIKLFRKDKDQIQKLKFIKEQVDEFRKQTSQFEMQTQLMNESNQLLEKQIQFQYEIYLETKSKSEAKDEVEKQKRKNDIKPRFIFNGSNGSGADFALKLLNKGGSAEKVNVKSVNTDQVSICPLKEGLIVERGQVLTIIGSADLAKIFHNTSHVSCQILLSFTNSDGDKYLQNIIKSYNGFQTGSPYEDNE